MFASRGYSVDQPLCVIPQDLPNTYSDNAAGTLLANLCTDAFRKATKADIGFSVNGLMRTGLTRGKKGVITVYDVFNVAPLGFGVVDTTAGSALVTGYFTGQELKNLLDFCLVDNPTHPGEFLPRASGMRYRYDMSRPQFDAVTAVELGDLDRGYSAIDITGKDQRLYSLTCPLMLGVFVVTIPKVTKGKLALVAKNKTGQPLATRLEALELPRENSGYLLAPPAKVDRSSVATGTGKHAVNEIKEWQAIMDYIRGLPVKNKGGLPTIPVDERAFGGSGIQNGLIGFGADGAQPKAGTFGANLKRFARAICAAAAKSSRSSASHAVRANSSVRQINASRMQSSWKGAFDRTPVLPLRRRLPCAIHLQPGGPSLLSLF